MQKGSRRKSKGHPQEPGTDSVLWAVSPPPSFRGPPASRRPPREETISRCTERRGTRFRRRCSEVSFLSRASLSRPVRHTLPCFTPRGLAQVNEPGKVSDQLGGATALHTGEVMWHRIKPIGAPAQLPHTGVVGAIAWLTGCPGTECTAPQPPLAGLTALDGWTASAWDAGVPGLPTALTSCFLRGHMVDFH